MTPLDKAGPAPGRVAPDGMTDAAAACIDAAARYLASEPAAVHRALATHRPGRDGCCTGCGRNPGRWPCATAASARRALDLLTGPGDPTA
ncbi:MAG: hypothetical protein ACRDRH_05875 [Pseudonocardia sp.]